MSGRPRKKNTIYRIKYSAVRQETLVLSAKSDEAAISELTSMLKAQMADENDTLEHFAICSVEPD